MMSTNKQILQHAAIATSAFAMCLLAGCGMGSSGSSAPTPVGGVALKGHLFGGQQPISGATIQLYAANTVGGYGSASTPLISAVVTTDANGNFGITGDYSCTGNPYVYIAALQGNPGLANGTNNASISQLAALGPCSSLTSNTFIIINELTTVATAYALSPFMADTTHVGTSANNVAGLAAAFNTVNELVNTTTGTAPGPLLPANSTFPLGEISTVADILSACVNSAGGTQGDGGLCDQLFAFTTVSGVRPKDTAVAAMMMAQHPGNQVSNIFGITPVHAPFQPTLATAPTDWTFAINHTGGGLNAPSAIAVDATGNVWLANRGNNSLAKLDSTGAAVSPGTGYVGFDAPVALALDSMGNVWVANQGVSPSMGSLMQVSSSGTVMGTYTSGGINAPSSVSIDATGTIWLTNSGANTVSAFTAAGSAVSANGFTGAGINHPVAIAINPKGN